jgi:acyl-CoA thioesterase FadM
MIPEPVPGTHVTYSEWYVGMADVDAVQIYYTRYFDWIGRGWERHFAELGHPFNELIDAGTAQPVVSAHCDFLHPVVKGDIVSQQTWIHRVGRTSFEYRDVFRSRGEVIAVGHSTRVWITLHPAQKAQPVPGWLRKAAGLPE